VTQADIDDDGNPNPGSGLIENMATVTSDELPDESDSASVTIMTEQPPAPSVIPVPVNKPWALLLMLLSILGVAWYFRPAHGRRGF
jgi:hypothetical protein